MNAAKPNETARHIRSLVGKNRIDEALTALYDFFTYTQDKTRLNDVIALQARFYGLSQAITRGTISETEAGVQRGQICNSILLMLDSIAPDASLPSPSKPVKKGKLLHNIPNAMQVGTVIECRVRIATTEKQIRKNFPGAEHIETISLERIGERMEVRLVAADSEAFIIKRQNQHARQFIDPDVHTEWVFDVIPMKTGHQKLYLKVDIIVQEKEGKAYRDEVISVPVEVCTTETPLTSEWHPVADLAPKADAGGGFFKRVIGGFLGMGRHGNARRMGIILVAAVAGVIMAAVFGPILYDEMDNWFLKDQSSPGTMHSVGIVVHSHADSAARQLTVSNQTVSMTKVRPGVWQTLIRVPGDSARHDIYYLGNVARAYWENVLLDKQSTHLYVVMPEDTAVCGVYIHLDTAVYPVENWRLVWQKNALENVIFPVIPISDTSFYVPLGAWCKTLYTPDKKFNFEFINGYCRLLAPNASLYGNPATLWFRHTHLVVDPPVTHNKPETGKIKELIVYRAKPAVPAKPVQYTIKSKVKKGKISLQLPPKWASHVKDLEITVDGKHFSSELPWKDGEIPFELPLTQERREICIRIYGQKTGEPVALGCYEGPIEPDMNLQILDGKIIRK